VGTEQHSGGRAVGRKRSEANWRHRRSVGWLRGVRSVVALIYTLGGTTRDCTGRRAAEIVRAIVN
jgi:hypothetical protein